MTYRPEIDGLRAVALLPVLLFHAGFDVFRGGFVGVDVFLVISGYLVTSIILKERAAGSFSIVRFYERRARRILPALYCVVLCCSPFAWFLMLPDPLENFGQSVVATVFFGNNVLLWLTSGYWELASEFRPLVHTWSLGVEEQFYLLFPLIAVVLWRFGRRTLLAAIVVLCGLSFMAGEVVFAVDADASFYLLHTRAWELLAGSLCACVHVRHATRPSNLLSMAGLGLIAFAVVSYDGASLPAGWALAPVGGAVLVIMFGGAGTVTATALSARWLVGVGLISYSGYLWHQPLFAFARINSYQPPSSLLMLALAIVALMLSYVSWKYVETPFRNSDTVTTASFITVLATTTVVLTGMGLALHYGHGVPGRVFTFEDPTLEAGMRIAYNERVYSYKQDRFPQNDRSNVLIAGNSFARDFVNAGVENGRFADTNVVYRDEDLSCVSTLDDPQGTLHALVSSADSVVFASGAYDTDCVEADIAYLTRQGVDTVAFIGTRGFGYNLNKFIQIDRHERAGARVRMLSDTIDANEELRREIPPAHFVDVIGMLSEDGHSMPVFTDEGHLIPRDRWHLTKAGARYVGARLFAHPLLEKF